MDLFDFDFDDDKKDESEFKLDKSELTIKDDSFKQERPLSVTELSGVVKGMVEGVGRVIVQGEISNLSKPASGHIYFKIKDERSTINAVIWKSAAYGMKFKPEEGLEVVLHGKLTTFAARSEYQINVTKLEPAGLGTLMQLFEKRKAELEKEGLFKPEYKQEINKAPETIAIITSQTGDVFHDILHRIKQRFPCNIILHPSKVQGDDAKFEIVEAIKNVNKLAETKKIDTIILARGGGSIEDLWSFNEEEVVRAVFESKVPVISAIGHEPDVTLVDYVADLRAPTPTGAAELATFEAKNMIYTIENLKENLIRSIEYKLSDLQAHVDRLKYMLSDNAKMIGELAVKFDLLKTQLISSIQMYQARKSEKLDQQVKMLESLSVSNVLKRGFAYVESEDGQIIKSSKTTVEDVKVHFADGSRKAKLK